jgi:NitT/TauT family transport system substrate-binding protein
MTRRRIVVTMALVALAVAPAARAADVIRLQLKLVPQAQFAGYYAAHARGLYRAENLDVTFLAGGPNVDPEEVVARGGADVGITWLPQLLVARERGLSLVNVAQLFAHSGLRQLALTRSGIRGPADLRGRRVAVWPDHEAPLRATLAKAGVDPSTIALVPQPLGMAFLVDGRVDAAAAMTYNELRLVREAGVREDQLTIIDFNAEGTATLEDGLFVRADWLRSPANAQIAARFVRASLRGWELCRDRPADCLAALHEAAPGLDRRHQEWMLTEVTKLIFGPPPPTAPLGRMPPDGFTRTATVLLRHGVLARPAERAAYTDAVWEAAQQRR